MLPLCADGQRTVAILGDSYSTFEGFVPQGNAVWYWQQCDTSRTDVKDVTDTWWWMVCKEGDYRLEVNESYSGACICNTDSRVKDPVLRSFLTRASRLGSPDIILVFGGTNDSWLNVPLGDFQWNNWRADDLKNYRSALCWLGYYLYGRYPNTHVCFIANSELNPAYVDAQRVVCEHYGFTYIPLHDIAKKSSHPTKAGMKSIAQQVLQALKL